MKCCEFEVATTNLAILRSVVDLFDFIFHFFCNNSEEVYDFSRQFLSQAISFLLLELYKMLTSLFFVNLTTENEIFLI